MNSRDLTLNTLQGTNIKIPFNPFIMHLAASLSKIDYCHDYCQNAELLADAQLKCADFFGIDHVNVSTDAYREASAWGIEINWESHTPVPRSFLNWKDFDAIEDPDMSSAPRVQNRVEAVRLLKKKSGSDQCVIGWIEAPFAELSCLFGLVNVLMIARYPDWENIMKKLVKRILPFQIEFAKMQIEAGADVIGAGDSAASQIGPMRYEKCFYEPTKELFTTLGKKVPTFYHCCGDNQIVDKDGRDMLKLIGSTRTSNLDVDYLVDLGVAKSKVGKGVCIRGNSNTQILGSSKYSPEEVITEITNTILKGKDGKHYMFGAGCEWPWEPLDLAIRNLSLAKAITEKLGQYNT
jgi:uroporphyrinogen-III decarboxylase